MLRGGELALRDGELAVDNAAGDAAGDGGDAFLRRLPVWLDDLTGLPLVFLAAGALVTAGDIDGMMVVEGGARSLEAVRRRCGGRV